MSNDTDKATARPWDLRGAGGNSSRDIWGGGQSIAWALTAAGKEIDHPDLATAIANAALIVSAVNSHDALVEACEKATNKLAESTGLVGVPMYAKCRKDYEADMLDIIREARAALALAGKVTP